MMPTRYRWNIHVSGMAIAVSAVASCAACELTPPVPPIVIVADAGSYDGAGLDDCARGCMRLAALGCREAGPYCADTCRHAQATRLTELAPACVALAPTPADVRACAPAWRNGCQ